MKASASCFKTLPRTTPTPNQFVVRGLLLFLILGFMTPSLEAATYGENLRHGLKRGVKNTLGAPAEIFITIQDYHERAGWPYVRQGMGLFVGTGKMLLRFGSGVVDLGASWIPGVQGGLPVDPETLF